MDESLRNLGELPDLTKEPSNILIAVVYLSLMF
jgi:hypothetical protein